MLTLIPADFKSQYLIIIKLNLCFLSVIISGSCKQTSVKTKHIVATREVLYLRWNERNLIVIALERQ